MSHIKNVIVKKNDRDHTLINLELLGGGTEIVTKNKWILDGDKFTYKEVSYIPVVMKIIDEIIDNSIDEAIRTKFEICNTINITITDDSVSVEDNGRGVPTTEHEGNIQSIVAFTEAKTSGNFDRENKGASIGKFGVGSFLTNVCSKLFVVDTSDGSQIMHLESYNNAERFDVSFKKSSKHFTKVFFKPDLELLKIEKIEPEYKLLLITRLTHLSLVFPEIKFTIN